MPANRPATQEAVRPEEVVRDEATVAYFDDHVPEYSVERLQRAADLINARKSGDSALIDVGCGTGNTLAYLHEATGLDRLVGIDVSSRCLEKAAEQVEGDLHHGSILDRELVERIGPQFDFAIVAAVLHHLIGRSRKESRAYARLAMEHVLALLRPGGHAIVMEPIFYPSLAMDGVFWLKKGLTRVTSRRIPVLGYWHNLGPPVVSYYTNEELVDMVRGAGARVVDVEIEEQRLPRALDAVLRRTDTTVLGRKPAPGPGA